MISHHDPETLASSAITSARLHGCDCTPDVEITEHSPGVFNATVLHDHDCHLLTRLSAPWN